MNREALKPVAFCCEHAFKAASDNAWTARLKKLPCGCDHHEYCDVCFPPEFREGGCFHADTPRTFTTQRPAPSPELVREIAEKHYTMLGEGVHETIVDAIESAINEALGHEGVKG